MVRIEPLEIVLAARGAGRLLRLCALGTVLHLGCTLITDVDRSKIPQPPPFEPEGDAGGAPEPEVDAGEPVLDAGEPDAATPLEDAGSEPVVDAAPDAPTPDAAAPVGDAGS